MKKKIIIVIGVIAVCLIAYVITWNIFMNNTYRKYKNNLGEEIAKIDGYVCAVSSEPAFPSMHGNLSVSQPVVLNSSTGSVNGVTIDLISFPSLIGEHKITIMLNDNNSGLLEGGYNSVSFSVLSDGSYNDDEEMKKYYEAYKPQVDEILTVYKKAFGIE